MFIYFLREHIAPVLCVAAIVNRSLVISGGEDSAVIVASLVDGTLVSALFYNCTYKHGWEIKIYVEKLGSQTYWSELAK